MSGNTGGSGGGGVSTVDLEGPECSQVGILFLGPGSHRRWRVSCFSDDEI